MMKIRTAVFWSAMAIVLSVVFFRILEGIPHVEERSHAGIPVEYRGEIEAALEGVQFKN